MTTPTTTPLAVPPWLPLLDRTDQDFFHYMRAHSSDVLVAKQVSSDVYVEAHVQGLGGTATDSRPRVHWFVKTSTCCVRRNMFLHEHVLDALLDGDADLEDSDTACGIVADNPLTRELLRFVAMPDAELRTWSGTSSEVRYRSLTIAALDALWD